MSVVIIGPTASGKSSLSLQVAQKLGNIEILSADAMAVYKQMDIGTAKPNSQQLQTVQHHLIDVVTPEENFTVSEFQKLAKSTLIEIQKRNNKVLVVGGTGLYVKSLIDELTIPPSYPQIRQELEQENDITRLWQQLMQLDPNAAKKIDPNNKRRIVRALEVCLGSKKPFSSYGPGINSYPNSMFKQIGIEIPRQELDIRIESRYEQQFNDGFIEEAKELLKLKLSRTARQALGYKEIFDYLNNEIDLETAKNLAIQRTKKFARRQQKWFRRDPRIVWLPYNQKDLVEQVSGLILDHEPI